MCLAIPGKVIEIRNDNGLLMGTVDYDGIMSNVCLAYV
ncbi:MAG: HypC/HybG/HupF family hydrogenase formation chaperone, partial [Spirochaetota bacterium]|nr:HypC/HybG/HupF family hydrogenase formation chaperone [Spirochaetota bacterium]